MALSLYDISVPPVIKGLRNLAGILERGRSYADETGIAHAMLLEARLSADMLPLTGQIQRASDTAKLMAVRIGGVANVPMSDTETTFDDLQKRIAATIAFLEGVPAKAVDGNEEAEIILPAAACSGSTPDKAMSSNSRSRTFSFTSPRRTIFFGTTACQLGSATISAGSDGCVARNARVDGS
jgi:hypothetical protein